MGQIFVRERRHAGEGSGRPRFTVIGVAGTDLKVFNVHVRRKEVEEIAKTVGAELVYLARGERGGEGGGRAGSGHRRHRGGGGGGGGRAED